MTMNNIIDVIRHNNSFMITSHMSPDGDAIGSSIALGLALKKINKRVTYVMDTPIQFKFSYMNEITCFNNLPQSDKFDVGIFLDCSDVTHLYNALTLDWCKITVNLDHHISNTGYGDLILIDSNASAAGEMIYELIHRLNIPLDADIAIALYTSIVTDTGNFKYSNVTAKTHKIISHLYEYPNQYWVINKRIFDEHSYGKIKLLGKALNNLYLSKGGKVAVVYLSMFDYSDADTDDEGIINYARDIQGVEVAMMLKEIGNKTYKISFRSNTDFDVSKLAAFYNGGGHQKAAGCTIKGCTRDEIIHDIMDKIHI
ncbi:MAG: DHH family phosphoesterase [Eubacteriales bacterium]